MYESSAFYQLPGPKTIKILENAVFYGYFRDFWKVMQIPCSRSISHLSSHFEVTIKIAIFHENYGFSSVEGDLRAKNVHKNQAKSDFLWFLVRWKSRPVKARKSGHQGGAEQKPI